MPSRLTSRPAVVPRFLTTLTVGAVAATLLATSPTPTPTRATVAAQADGGGHAGSVVRLGKSATWWLGTANEWSRDVRRAPIASNSEGLVANLANQVATRWGGNASFNAYAYNVSLYTVGPDAPRRDVLWDNCTNKRRVPRQLYDPEYGAHFASVPIPPGALPSRGTDAALTIWQPSTDQIWEFWKTSEQSDGWHACWGGRRDNFSASPGYFLNGMGATATGLIGAAGAVGFREAARGSIDHAVGLALPEVAHWSTYSYPAQRSDGKLPLGAPNAIMEGLRFRLDPAVDIDALGLHPLAAMIAKAAQTYGFIIKDGSGAVTPTIESGDAVEAATGTNPWVALLDGTRPSRVMRNFPWDRLQALPENYGQPTATQGPRNTGRPGLRGAARAGQTMSADPGTWTGFDDASFGYQWIGDDSVLPGATRPTYTPTAEDVGTSLRVVVTARDATSAASAVSERSSVVRPPAAPTALVNTSRPTIRGTAHVGRQMVAEVGAWAPSEGITHSYQWLAGGAPVPGATSSTFTPTADHLGRSIRLRVYAEADGYLPSMASSRASSRVAAGSIATYRRPAVRGRARVGRTLVVRPGSYSRSASRVASRWFADGRRIRRAAGRRYRVTMSDAGKQIQARVTVAAPGYTPRQISTRPTRAVPVPPRHRRR